MRNLQFNLNSIYESIEATQTFIEGTDYEAFVVDDKTNSAVVYKLEAIGDTVKHIPDTIQEKYSEIPWQKMTEMSDRFIQYYYDIDYTLVWETVKDLIPQMQPIIAQILEETANEVDNRHYISLIEMFVITPRSEVYTKVM